METTCQHQWLSSGLWDGKTPENQPTGGVMYKCTKCGEVATSKKQIDEKGGKVIEGTDIYGRPTK